MSNSIKPPQTGPSAATTLILALLSIMVLCYVLFRVFSGLNAPYELSSAYTYEADDETTVSGYVVREESLLPSQNGGVLDITLAEGERVAAGAWPPYTPTAPPWKPKASSTPCAPNWIS